MSFNPYPPHHPSSPQPQPSRELSVEHQIDENQRFNHRNTRLSNLVDHEQVSSDTLYNPPHPDFNPVPQDFYSSHHPNPTTSPHPLPSPSRRPSLTQLLLPTDRLEPYYQRAHHHISSSTLIDRHTPSSRSDSRSSSSPPKPSSHQEPYLRMSNHQPNVYLPTHHQPTPFSIPANPRDYNPMPNPRDEKYGPGFGSLERSQTFYTSDHPQTFQNQEPIEDDSSRPTPEKSIRSPISLRASPPKPSSSRLTRPRIAILTLIACLLIATSIGVIVFLHTRRLKSINAIAGDDGDVIAKSGLGSAREGSTEGDDDPFGGGPPNGSLGPDNGLRGGLNGYDSLIVFGASYCDNAHARPAEYASSLRPPPYFKGLSLSSSSSFPPIDRSQYDLFPCMCTHSLSSHISSRSLD